MATKNQIITDISNRFRGYPYSRCYIGITSNLGRRLKGEHNVPTRANGGIYISRAADSNAIAREVEKHFLDAGMDGSGGGSRTARLVYAYKKIPRVTRQRQYL